MVNVTSWGRLGSWAHEVTSLSDRRLVPQQLSSGRPGIAYGMGRSYGDMCLNPGGTLWRTTGLDRFISFDQQTGFLICEAGVLLRDVQRLVVPCGWMLPVTPGTQLVTIGGAIANDVHGKNHHVVGSFGNHVEWLRLVRTDGATVECGPTLHPEWFAATVGGMGLTGVITEAAIQLRPVPGPWLETETIAYTHLDEFFRLSDDSEREWEYTVSWLDCLDRRGRGIFMRGNSVKADPRPEPPSHQFTMPLMPPVSLVNEVSLRAFNSLYFRLQKWRAGRTLLHYESFFYPLDHILEWNRMYGPKGFFQYQCVIPREAGHQALRGMLRAIARSGEGSFLAVLKTFGFRESRGMMSFPRSGVTLALDFPNHGERTSKLFARLDAIVLKAQGRIYPAKDARMPRALFEAGYPHLHEFLAYRDPGISSALSRRLLGS